MNWSCKLTLLQRERNGGGGQPPVKSAVRAQSNTVGRLRIFWGGDAREHPGGLLRLDPAFSYAEPPSSLPLSRVECLPGSRHRISACSVTVDLLLEGAAGDQLEHLDAPALAPAVDPVRGLVLAGGVPPPVVVDDDARARQVDPDAAGHEAAHEDPA